MKVDNLKKYKLYWYIKKLRIKSQNKIFFEKANFNRISFIHRALRKFPQKTAKYLEIGVFQTVFDTIYLSENNKYGSITKCGNLKMTSDEFFKK